MKMRMFSRTLEHPIIEIIPQAADFVGWNAGVELHFFSFDAELMFQNKSWIRPNVQFVDGSGSAEINEWGNIFIAAAMIADRNPACFFVAPGNDAVISEAWRKVDEIKARMRKPAAEAGIEQ